MSLSTAFNIAQSSLLSSGRQSNVLARNIQESNNPEYSRRTAVVASLAPGARTVLVQRATHDQLFRQNLSALADWSGQSALSSGMEQLELTVLGVDNSTSAATAIGKLQQALQTFSASPSNLSLGENAVNAAREVVTALNNGTAAIQALRVDTDQQIAESVGTLNGLLQEFKAANDAVVNGVRAGRDVNDALDTRDAVLKKIGEFVPVTTMSRADGDVALMTRDGATLFDRIPRAVTFQPSAAYAPGVAGNNVYVDGVPVGFGNGGSGTSGRLAGLVQLRDGVASTMQRQLDEVARGLVSAFRETGAAVPDAAGLFTWAGAPAMPAAGTLVDGLAGSIRVNAAFDSGAGGNPLLLRDGGANGAAYVANVTGGSGYADLLIAYADRLETPMAFDPAAGIGASMTVTAFSATSIGWFEGVRQEASSELQNKEALSARISEALSNETGVNVDTEMALLLDLENAYEATSRLLKAIDDMMAMLMAVT
jgi:flagellar hook-associated protein 1 FlgK